jgi:hypothetical protein
MDKIPWKKSTRSVGNPQQCVELGAAVDTRYVRDTKNQDGPVLIFPIARFAAFLREVQGNL